MTITKEYIRFSIYFAFHLKKNATEATAMLHMERNSAQNEKELAEQLGVTQTISVRLHMMGKVKKEGRCVRRMNYPKTTKIDGVTLHSLCFQNSGKKIFCTKSGDEK